MIESTSTPPATTTSTSAAELPRLLSCTNAAEFQPSAHVLACGDGNASVKNLRWQSWTASNATAQGQWEQNDCQPDCASGHFHTYTVGLVLDRPTRTKLGVFFDRLTATFSGPSPMGRGVETVEPLLPASLAR
jgi:hypothetical protein